MKTENQEFFIKVPMYQFLTELKPCLKEAMKEMLIELKLGKDKGNEKDKEIIILSIAKAQKKYPAIGAYARIKTLINKGHLKTTSDGKIYESSIINYLNGANQ